MNSATFEVVRLRDGLPRTLRLSRSYSTARQTRERIRRRRRCRTYGHHTQNSRPRKSPWCDPLLSHPARRDLRRAQERPEHQKCSHGGMRSVCFRRCGAKSVSERLICGPFEIKVDRYSTTACAARSSHRLRAIGAPTRCIERSSSLACPQASREGSPCPN